MFGGAGHTGGVRDPAEDPEPPEELLAAGRPPPRWARPLGAALVVVVGGYLAVHAIATNAEHRPAALPSAPQSHSPQIAPPIFRQPGGGPHVGAPWPTAAGECGQVQVPLVTGAHRAHGTGLSVLVGGPAVRRVEVDPGRSRLPVQPALRRGEYVAQLAGRTAVTSSCAGQAARTFSVGSRAAPVAQSGYLSAYRDGARSHLVRVAQNPPGASIVVDGRPVRLPNSFSPAGVTSGVVVGTVQIGGERSGLGVLVDAHTGRVVASIGYPQSLAAGDGQVVGAYGCDVSLNRPCELRGVGVHGGPSRSYPLPRSPGMAAPVVSPDGRAVAFTLQRAGPDPRYNQDEPLPPTDIAVLRLDTGRLELVPGIELPAKSGPGLAFSPDGRWLVIALDAGRRTRLLVWRSGLPHPLETTPIGASAPYAPPVEVVP